MAARKHLELGSVAPKGDDPPAGGKLSAAKGQGKDGFVGRTPGLVPGRGH